MKNGGIGGVSGLMISITDLNVSMRLVWAVFSKCFFDQPPIHQSGIAILNYLKAVAWDYLDIANFALQRLAEVLEVELHWKVVSAAQLAIH